MGSKTLQWTPLNDAYSEDVLKCIKETLKREPQLIQQYRPIKTTTRNYETHKTWNADERSDRTRNHERRNKNLSLGFFSDRTKPYQPLGTVLLDDGDLLLESITDDVRAKITKLPRRCTKDKDDKPEKLQSHFRKGVYSPAYGSRRLPKKEGIGFSAIKECINEMNEMKQNIQRQSGYLLDYLIELPGRKKMNAEKIAKKSKSKSSTKSASSENNCLTTEGLIQPRITTVKYAASIASSSDKESEMGENASQSGDKQSVDSVTLGETKKSNLKPISVPGEKLSALHRREEMREYEKREQELREFRKKNRAEYTKLKLQTINSLFCALYNMRVKLTRLPNTLSQKSVKDLLRSDVIINNFGRPAPWRHQTHKLATSYDERSSVAEESTASSMETPSESKLHLGVGNSTVKKQTGSNTNLQNTSFKGLKGRPTTGKPLTPTSGDSHDVDSKARGSFLSTKYSRKRRDTISQIAGDTPTPWLHVHQSEKKILETVRVNCSGNVSTRTAESVLEDSKRRFARTQTILQRETIEECTRLKNERAKIMKCKYLAITVSPLANSAFNRMRTAAKLKVIKDRKDSLAQPLKWYVNLRDDVMKEPNSSNYFEILEKIARFQFESDKTIPFAKEKLCLLVMSMPAHMLLTAHMVDALHFTMKKVLNTTSELLQVWFSCRKLDKISLLLKKQYKRRITE